jgi:HAD superfamily hydrolase (TIGR01509 family)
VLSYQTGHIKPEAEIYQLAIDQYGLTPGRTGYIDDLPGNIEAGSAAGFICHQYCAKRHAAFRDWLTPLLQYSG